MFSTNRGKQSGGIFRRALVLCILHGIGACATVRAQGLMGLGYFGRDGNASVISIDPVTGRETRLLSTSANFLVQVPMGFDPSTRRLFFEDRVGVRAELYTADLAHGTVSHVPIECCPSLQYDVSTNVLLGLGLLGSDTKASVFSIDPTTGIATRILSTPAARVMPVSIGFDPSTRRLFFEDGAELYTADLTHGTVSHVPFDCCISLQFDTGANQLLGVGRHGTEIEVSVLSIDPITGNATRLLSTGSDFFFGTLAFDPSARRLYFEGWQDLYTADLVRGTVSHLSFDCCPRLFFATSLATASVPLLNPVWLSVLVASLALIGWKLARGRSA